MGEEGIIILLSTLFILLVTDFGRMRYWDKDDLHGGILGLQNCHRY